MSPRRCKPGARHSRQTSLPDRSVRLTLSCQCLRVNDAVWQTIGRLKQPGRAVFVRPQHQADALRVKPAHDLGGVLGGLWRRLSNAPGQTTWPRAVHLPTDKVRGTFLKLGAQRRTRPSRKHRSFGTWPTSPGTSREPHRSSSAELEDSDKLVTKCVSTKFQTSGQRHASMTDSTRTYTHV